MVEDGTANTGLEYSVPIHDANGVGNEGAIVGIDLRGARERLAPILMTALATGLALVPLVILGDIPCHEIEYPMAVVILGYWFLLLAPKREAATRICETPSGRCRRSSMRGRCCS